MKPSFSVWLFLLNFTAVAGDGSALNRLSYATIFVAPTINCDTLTASFWAAKMKQVAEQLRSCPAGAATLLAAPILFPSMRTTSK